MDQRIYNSQEHIQNAFYSFSLISENLRLSRSKQFRQGFRPSKNYAETRITTDTLQKVLKSVLGKYIWKYIQPVFT